MSESLKDVVSSVKDAIITPVQEAFVYRAKNPFFGSLIISWVYWNWNKIAYMLLSDDDVLKKIEFIKKSIPDNTLIPFTSFREGANKQVISSQADSLIKISRIWADFFPANTSNQ
ncbi:hypothetical protein M2C11_28085, partial [Klebsiella pneumoniae]|nr:hypothetical protein [Klebsiella pneumoniae]MDZ3208629.1 hypothetical protein [Klebsiella pneumoniae]